VRPRRHQTVILLFDAAIAWSLQSAFFGVCWLIALAAAYTLTDAVRWVRIAVACLALFAFPLMVMARLIGASTL